MSDHPAPVLETGPADGPRLLLAHGAGAPMDSDWMAAVAGGLADAGVRVIRFEFPYMARRRDDGRRRPPDREPILLDTWRALIAAHGPADRLVIGGKSMGGRMASLIADAEGVRGLVCLGYPFHPPGKPDRLRTAHLEGLRTPTLICQGTRDTLGGRTTVEAVALSASIRLCWLEDGDHGFKPRKASGHTEAAHLATAVAETAAFVHALAGQGLGS
ncbi:alpha/beta family hydrolase [Roseospira navarrensis]|uniref:Alpha/beta hydrolase n=1 Tax=Roseospira navarrensis TaxID=140058 RepID=A0A7X1ZFF3_9PROT|nr:alpha/beta family hydrolase [Roseospira navarrensis]MQX37588.1 alpha/beta hydrolase [Roseospira navarrensis]